MAEAFPISGNIDPKTFPFLLADLHRQGATGSLKVEGPSYPKALYFRGGRVLFGSSNDPKDQLGSILIESGKITQEQLDDVNTKVGPGNPLAKVLAESGFVNQRELSEAARVKVERILSDVLSYTSGSFEFEDGVLPKGAVDLKLSTEKLVLAAVARLSDRGFVLRHLDSLAVVLAPTADMGERMAELRPEAGDLPERFDGQRTLKEAAALDPPRRVRGRQDRLRPAVPRAGREDRGRRRGRAAADELDLAADGAHGLATAGGRHSPAPAEPEPAFFVPEAEDAAGERPSTSPCPTRRRPRFGESETPPLGLRVPDLLAAVASQPDAEPEGAPTVVGFSMAEQASRSPGFSFSERTTPRRRGSTSIRPRRRSARSIPAPAPAPAPSRRRRRTRSASSAPPPPFQPDFTVHARPQPPASGLRGRAGPRTGGPGAPEQGGPRRPRRAAQSLGVDALHVDARRRAREPSAGSPRFARGRPHPFRPGPTAGSGGFPVVPVAAGAAFSRSRWPGAVVLLRPAAEPPEQGRARPAPTARRPSPVAPSRPAASRLPRRRRPGVGRGRPPCPPPPRPRLPRRRP